MQPLAHLMISLALAAASAASAAAVAADRAALAKAPDELQSRQAALDKAVALPADTKASRAADRKLLAAVRRALIHDNTLSMAAHNVKLKASAGVITITGDVRTAAEKAKVEAIAKKVAGASSVESQITVPQPAAAAKAPKAKPVLRENTTANSGAKTEKTR